MKGNIQIHSQNIMPVIKKWLYSDKDIFLREMISNAADAISKYQKLAALGQAPREVTPRIVVRTDKEARTLSIEDNGIGMTGEEVQKYITQVAFSGAEDFLAKYKDAGKDGIIGHFGLGFYSAYMVSDTVEIDTLSFEEGSKPVHWVSDGNEEYEMTDGTRAARGTLITLHIAEGEDEFLQEYKIRELLKKYCAFMPYEIYLNPKDEAPAEGKEGEAPEAPKPVNNTSPLYLRDPKTVTDEEYVTFYRDTFHDFAKPLFWIHLNVDYPFNLKGILYFPKQSEKLDVQGEVKLYCNQVFIADNIKEVIPEFLMLLKGVIDCPDIPLNVSRSFLQNDREVKKISRHITKKVADKLNELFKEDREKYAGFFGDISPFVKFGCMKDSDFYDKVKDILLFKDLNGKWQTLAEFKAEQAAVNPPKEIPAEEGDKEEGAEKHYEPQKLFYVTDENLQSSYIRQFKDNGLNAVYLNQFIDVHFISFLEYVEPSVKFLRIDAETPDCLKAENLVANPNEIIELFKQNIEDKEAEVNMEALKDASVFATFTRSEFSRRFAEMNKLYGMGVTAPGMKEESVLTLNGANPLIAKLTSLPAEKLPTVCGTIYDLAVMANKPMTGDQLQAFLKRAGELLNAYAG